MRFPNKPALIKYGDFAGMAASILCLLHCIAMPLVILAFPMLGLAHAHDHFHDTLLAAITLPVLLALVPGYLRHRDRRTLAIGVAGLALFLSAVFIASPLFGEAAEAVLAVVSGFMLLYAHLRNRRHCKRCGTHTRTRTGVTDAATHAATDVAKAANAAKATPRPAAEAASSTLR